MTRRYLTAREKRTMLAAQGWLCGCGCGRPVWPGGPVEYDHGCPVALGNHGKPDVALTPFCHRLKTAADVRQIRKADRQRAKAQGKVTRKGRKLTSGGFTGWRKMNGEIIRKWRE